MKKTGNTIKFICAVLIFVLGVGMFIHGVSDIVQIEGSYAIKETYGGDAYTGIQNAAATTANNILYLGYELERTIEQAYTWGGVLLVVLSLYIFACALTSVERKKKTPSEQDAITILAKYKNLLDSGAITQEEFDEKKKEFFNV